MGYKRKYRMVTNTNDPQFLLRIPLDLKKDIEARAKFKGHGRNPEIANILGMVMQHNIDWKNGYVSVGDQIIEVEESND